MALPGLNELKGYLRKETADEDVLLTALLARAGAAVRYYLDRPIEKVTRTYRIERDSTRAYPVFTKLVIPAAPISVAMGEEPEVVDGDGATVDPALYTVDPDTAVLRAIAGESFGNFPYDVTVKEGLATRASYLTVEEPLIGSCILDYAAELYQHRNPGATQESELGVSTSYGMRASDRSSDGLPPRFGVALESLRRVL
jgi:hypothetical protein